MLRVDYFRSRALLLEEFQQGRDEKSAVENICKDFGVGAVTSKDAKEWFSSFRHGSISTEPD